MSNSNIIEISQKIATFPFNEPSYEELVETAIEVLRYLQTNPQDVENPQFRPIKGLFWEVIMRVANVNQFTKTN